MCHKSYTAYGVTQQHGVNLSFISATHLYTHTHRHNTSNDTHNGWPPNKSFLSAHHTYKLITLCDTPDASSSSSPSFSCILEP